MNKKDKGISLKEIYDEYIELISKLSDEEWKEILTKAEQLEEERIF